jgi:hypothetical protein
MAVNTLLDHAALGEDQSQQQEQSPYLPPEPGRLPTVSRSILLRAPLRSQEKQ